MIGNESSRGAGFNRGNYPVDKNRSDKRESERARSLIVQTPLIPPRRVKCGAVVEIRSALVPLRVCSAALGVSEGRVMEMIEEGRLRWAWDLRRKQARRAFVFVLAQSLLEAQNKDLKPHYTFNDADAEEWTKVLELVLPHQKPLIKGSEIVRAFSISSQHMMNFVNDGVLVALNARRRRTATPVITRDSVIKLLKERRIF
ncbi:MAG: hypothetical protein ACP5MG_11900 [Verrucomicrobiia bacterium]|jgi:hypothetical protein